MIGAIVGDIAGSRFEFCNLKSSLMAVAMMAVSMALADDVKYKDFGLIIPFEFNYSFALGSDFKLSPYAGPIFELGLVSKSKSDDEEVNWFDNDLFNYKRLGIYLGVGAMLDFQDMLRLKVGYNFGLLDGIKECKVPATDMEAKNKGLVVSVGYLF